jgi:hypothetical protein
MYRYLRLRGYHPLWPAFPNRSAYPQYTTGLFHVRSPLLAESLLMSFPPGTEMFQFPGFASPAYVFSGRYPKGVGCPIRISTDQSLLAAPHGFSQRATSFIASWCQGIHRMPFSYSIQNTDIRPKTSVSIVTNHAQEPSPDVSGNDHAHGISSQLSTVLQTPLTTIATPDWTTLGSTCAPPRSLPVRQSPSVTTDEPTQFRTSSRQPKPSELSYAPRSAPEPDSQHKRT